MRAVSQLRPLTIGDPAFAHFIRRGESGKKEKSMGMFRCCGLAAKLVWGLGCL